MKINYLNFKNILLAAGFSSLILFSCSGDKKGEATTNNPEDLPDDTGKVTTNSVLNVGGQLFSIPSPVQTAMLIQKTGAAYDKSILNSKDNKELYKTDFSKALNLGIYGADLGYVTMYNKTQDALGYLAAVKKMADELGVSGAFDTKTMDRIQNNITNKDSMLVLVGIAYRASDAFLKNNDRTDVSGLILTGGWIESLNFAISVYKSNGNEEVKKRVAEQRQALSSIIKLLSQYETQAEFGDLLNSLRDLNKIYEGIQFKYVYVAPVTDAGSKMTTLNSTTEVIVTKEQMDQITNKIKEIRNKITNPVKA